MYARNSSSVTPSNTLAPVKCSSFGSTDAITLKKTSGRSWLTRSRTEVPCCSQCAWRSHRNFSLNLDRLPKGRPAGFPLCPGCHGGANCPFFLLTSSTLAQHILLDSSTRQYGGKGVPKQAWTVEQSYTALLNNPTPLLGGPQESPTSTARFSSPMTVRRPTSTS